MERQINQAKFLSATTTLMMLPVPPHDTGEFQQAVRIRLPKEFICCSEDDSLVVLPHPEIVAATLLNSMLTKKVSVIPLRSKHEDLSLILFRLLTDEYSSTRQKILEAKKPASYLLNCLPSVIRDWSDGDDLTGEVFETILGYFRSAFGPGAEQSFPQLTTPTGLRMIRSTLSRCCNEFHVDGLDLGLIIANALDTMSDPEFHSMRDKNLSEEISERFAGWVSMYAAAVAKAEEIETAEKIIEGDNA